MRRAKKKTPTKIKKSEQTPLPPGPKIGRMGRKEKGGKTTYRIG